MLGQAVTDIRSILRTGLLVLAILVSAVLPATMSPVVIAQQPQPLYLVELDGVITTVSAGYVRRALNQAEAAGASALVLRLSSSGGVLRVLRSLARDIHDAKVPVVVYVAPAGVEAGAAGALLLSGAHIAAMAPNTSFGSPYPLAQLDAVLSEDTRELLIEDLSQQLRSWNRDRQRSAEWVERGVREGIIRSNVQAIAATPAEIDLVAANLTELMTLLEGRQVTLTDGSSQTLRTLGQVPTVIAPSAWERFRLLLADPTVAFLLFVLAGVAIYCELANPGTTLFAGIGVVFLVASVLGGLAILPVRMISVAGLVVAFGLVIADLFTPSHGGLTVTGIALLVVSALTLVDPIQAPGVGVALWAILLVAFSLATITALGVWLVFKAQRRPVTTGKDALIGALAEVRQPLQPEGMVFVDGALWQAISEDGSVERGVWVKVVALERLRLIVRRLDPGS